jgi:hypothetical protein
MIQRPAVDFDERTRLLLERIEAVGIDALQSAKELGPVDEALLELVRSVAAEDYA